MKNLTKGSLSGIFLLFLLGLGFIIGWFIYYTCIHRTSVNEIQTLLVIFVLSLLLLIIVYGLKMVFTTIGIKTEEYFGERFTLNYLFELNEDKLKKLSYLDFEQITPIIRTLQIFLVASFGLIALIVIGLIIII